VRTILLELERVWNHLNDIAAICAGVGLAAGNNAFAALTERARRLNHTLTGHRFLRGAVHVARSELLWDATTIRTATEALTALRGDAARYWRELAFNSSFQDRLSGVGVIDSTQAETLGTVGPPARAAGLTEDARNQASRLTYPGFVTVALEQPDGDVRARYEQRALELWQSFDLLEGLLDGPVSPSRAEPDTPSGAPGIGIVEGPRGRTTCIVEPDGDRIGRLHLRTASFANWPAVAAAAAGNLLPDFPLINKSFELCYACVDR
jgi:Ni,Fe-hydrogenase III large subunit